MRKPTLETISRAAYQELKSILVQGDAHRNAIHHLQERARVLTGDTNDRCTWRFLLDYTEVDSTKSEDERLEERLGNYLAALDLTVEPTAEEKIVAAIATLRDALQMGGLPDHDEQGYRLALAALETVSGTAPATTTE